MQSMIKLLTHHDTGWKVDPDYGTVYGPRGKPFVYVHKGRYFSAKRPGSAKSIRKNLFLHRVVWEAVNGPIDNSRPDRFINHINGNGLDNRICNLELVTNLDNVHHAIKTGLTWFDEDHGSAVLTTAQVIDIRDRYGNGESVASLSEEYGVAHNTIRFAANGTSWKHIPTPEKARTRTNKRAVVAYPLSEGPALWFRSVRATRGHGFNPATVCLCCQGRLKSHKGYQWAYDMS